MLDHVGAVPFKRSRQLALQRQVSNDDQPIAPGMHDADVRSYIVRFLLFKSKSRHLVLLTFASACLHHALYNHYISGWRMLHALGIHPLHQLLSCNLLSC